MKRIMLVVFVICGALSLSGCILPPGGPGGGHGGGLAAGSHMVRVCVNNRRPFSGPIRISWYQSIPPFLNENNTSIGTNCNALAGLLSCGIKQRQRFGRFLNRFTGLRDNLTFSEDAIERVSE